MIYIILGNGFEEMEALTPCDILRRCGAEVQLVGIGPVVTGGHGITVQADITVEQMDLRAADMIVLPGGLGGVQSIGECQVAMDAIKAAYEAGKYVAAICAGPTLLARLGITDGKRVTSYPGTQSQMGSAVHTAQPTELDGRIITGEAAGSAVAFGLKLAEVLCGEDTARRVADAIIIR